VPAADVPQPGVPTDVPGDVFTFIETALKQNRVQVVEKGFLAGPNALRDVPAGGGILVGFNARAIANGPFGPQVSGLQPIYLTRKGEKVHAPAQAGCREG